MSRAFLFDDVYSSVARWLVYPELILGKGCRAVDVALSLSKGCSVGSIDYYVTGSITTIKLLL
jgi:hypothetical protein